MKKFVDYKKWNFVICYIVVVALFSIGFVNYSVRLYKTESVNATNVSTKKINWGIKRNNNHAQPDVGTENKKILEENSGICLGNNEKKYIYLTFDEGYEAGYTKSILETLKQNNVNATFFITAHYLNTEPELVKQMIDEGHIVGNHTPTFLMSFIFTLYRK